MKNHPGRAHALCTDTWWSVLRRSVPALAVAVALLGGDAARADEAPGGITGTFGENGGSAEVAPGTGAMTYTVPFQFPAARGTAQPALSLRYASGAGAGEAGVGWSLDLPSIERAPLSGWPKYIDPTFDSAASEDRYAYSGRALTFICVFGGSPACDASEAVGPAPSLPDAGAPYRHYRLQVEGSFERFFLSHDRKTWIVQRRGGEILEFGAPLTKAGLTGPAYDVKAGTASVFRWNLARQHDRHGDLNAIVYSWAGSSPERQYLRDIYYSPGAAAASVDAFAYHVELSWGVPSFLPKDYTPIDRRRIYRRLRRVAVSSTTWSSAASREIVRAYTLAYYADRSVPPNPGEAPLWGKSSLASVTTEGRCSLSEVGGRLPDPTGCPSLPPVTFDYQAAELAVGVATRSAVAGDPAVGNGGLPNVVNSAVVDINRDGLPDIVHAWPQNIGNTKFNECPGGGLGARFVVRRAPNGPDPAPELGCEWEFPVGHTNYLMLRSAREQSAYINRGAIAGGSLSLQHNCLDAGDGSTGTITGYHVTTPSLEWPAALFDQYSAEAIGAWGNASMLWSIAGYRGFKVQPAAANASFCANLRVAGTTTYPAQAWQLIVPSAVDWAKDPQLPMNTYRTMVDVDGDGYADLLAEPSQPATSPSGYFKNAAVMFTSKISALEVTNGIPGPALIPFAGATTGSAPITTTAFAQEYATYVDVNGDGVVDLVTAQPAVDGGTPRVRPGNGRGGFGCDPAIDVTCVIPNDGFVGKAYSLFVPDAAKPWPLHQYAPYANGATDTHFFHDVTGDGLPDIVAYQPGNYFNGASSPGTLKLWINVDGRTFRCANATDCVVATITGSDQPQQSGPKYRAVFADIDGNGTEDFVLLGTTGVWHFSFLLVAAAPPYSVVGTRAPRPGLLTRIRNGVGAETEIVYQTIQELEATFTDPAPGSFHAPWSTHSPVVIPVVTRIQTRDSRIVAGGAPIEPYQVDRTTRFEYRDPAFDPWEQSFKGWKRVRAVGPSGEAQQTWFWFGACESGGFVDSVGCPGGSENVRANDNALAGAVVRVDRFVPNGPGEPTKWLSTTTSQFQNHPGGYITPPGNTPDRPVMFAAAIQDDTYIYDTNTAVSAVDDIVSPLAPNGQTHPRQVIGTETHLRTQTAYDGAGNVQSVTRLGRLDTNALPTLDSQIQSVSLPASGRCQGDWGCPATESTVSETLPDGSVRPLRHVGFGFNTAGDLVSVSAELSYPQNTAAGLFRSLPQEGGFGTGAPATASTALGMRLLRTFGVDAYGNVRSIIGQSATAVRPCTTIDFDGSFNQFPERVTQYTGSACTGGGLRTQYIFDRGLGAASAVNFPNQTMQTTEFDAFGRVSAVYAPAPDAGPFATELAVRMTHHTQSPVSWTEIARRTDGDFVTSIEIFNGVGEPVLGFDQADTLADGAPWIARSWTERDVAGAPTSTFRPWFFSGDAYAVAATAPALNPVGARLQVIHDQFGRPTYANDDYVNTAQLTYLPLQTTVQDAEQLKPGSPFAGLSSTRKVDGHGRTIESTVPAGTGSDTTTTRTKYLGTGEPVRIERSKNADPPAYVRTVEWDSFGRMISNHEPNTSTLATDWSYVYDDEGRLVGTSDARRCGKNFDYDALGRLLSEDFSPCLAEQAAYTTPDLVTGDGTETFNVYDAYEPGQVSPTAAFADSASLAVGQLVAVHDRGAHTRINYDGRGRSRRVTRRMAKPDVPERALADRYASHWFKQEADFDLGDRLRTRTTGLESHELTGGVPSFETMTYSARGALRAVGSSYGDLVTQLTHTASGAPSSALYGDLAGTAVSMGYDARDRLAALLVRRGASPALWSAAPPPAGYTLPGTDTTQLTLTDLRFARDDVGNPTAINDLSADTWPSGSRPVSRAMTYDSAYRMKHVDYTHGADAYDSPYRAEASVGDRRPVAQGRASARILSQDFASDALGNVISSGDNESLRFDRSLGVQYNGTGVDGSVHGPNQLIDADGMHATYDAAGNLAELTVARGSCSSEMPGCSHRFLYDWDETGQLARARRWDFGEGPVPAFDPNVLPAWDLSYAYGAGGRTRVTTKDALGTQWHTLDVFGTLRLVHVDYVIATSDYLVLPKNEVGFVGGVARVFYDSDGVLPTAGTTPLHVFLDIGDHLGSSAFIIDKDSGEVVERTTHQPYGALETDFRPNRWGSAREAFKFTGKEEDIEVGATYFGARYYQARLGRWMSADPLTIHGLGGDLNPYAYVAGRVMSSVDPFGLDPDIIEDTVIVHGQPREVAVHSSAADHGPGMASIFTGPSPALIQELQIKMAIAQVPQAFQGNPAKKPLAGRKPTPPLFGDIYINWGRVIDPNGAGHALIRDGQTVANPSAPMMDRAVAVVMIAATIDPLTAPEAALERGAVRASAIVEGGGLAAHEAAGGHLLARHVGLDAAALDARLGNVTVASSFATRAEAEAAGSAVLGQNAGAITGWTQAGAAGRLPVSGAFSGGTVRVLGGYSAEATKATFVLQGNGAGGFFILTGFPAP